MFWESKAVLVTGGAGFVGSHVVDKLIELGAKVTIADNLSKGSLGNVFEVWSKHVPKFDRRLKNGEVVADGHSFLKVDLEDKSQAKRVVEDKDIVIHLAADIGGRGYIDTYPAQCCKNFAINHNVIEEAAEAGVERVHYSSTACVYPVSLQSEYNSSYLLREEDAFKEGWANCDGEYGWSKFMGELELKAFHEQYGLKCSIARYVTAYGERENDTHAIMALIRKAVEGRDPYVIWGDGEQDRDFTYISDVVAGTLLITEKITDGSAINLGTSTRYKIRDVAFKILELVGHRPSRMIFDDTKPVGVISRALDISKAKELLGWRPKVPLEEGLRRTIDWYINARPTPMETLE